MPVENYLLNVPDPTQQVLEGLKVGGAIRQQREQRKRSESLNAALGALGPESTIDDYAALAPFLAPDQLKGMLDVWDRQNDLQKENTLQFAGQVLSAIRSDPAVAVDLINTRAEAERNSGNVEQAKAWGAIAQAVKTDPEAGFHATATMLAALPGAKEYIEGLGILGEEKRAEEELPSIIEEREAGIAETEAKTAALTWETLQSKDMADIVKRQGEAEVGNIEADTKLKLANAAKLAAESEGKLAGPDKSKLELDLSDDFEKRVKSVRANIDQVAKIEQAAADDTGAGDLALIFAFMKMLDPGSVVRESEYARAAEAQGLFRKMGELYNKIQDGRFLAPNARKMFAKLAKKLINHSMAYGSSQFQLTSERVKNYNLNMNNVLSKGDQRAFGQIAIEYVKGEELKDMAALDKLSAMLDQQAADPNANFIDPNTYFGDEEEPVVEQEPSYMRHSTKENE